MIRLVLAVACAAMLVVATAACGHRPGRAPYIDLGFPVWRHGTLGSAAAYSFTIDASGTLWYLDGGAVVHEPDPSHRRVLLDSDLRGGVVFWYENAIYVLHSGGKRFTRVDDRTMHEKVFAVPSALTPLLGVQADSRIGALVATPAQPGAAAVADGWKWSAQPLPRAFAPLALSLAGGPHGKRYVVAADAVASRIAIADRRTGGIAVVGIPDRRCALEGHDTQAPPIGLKPRDGDRVWVSSGARLASVGLSERRVLRVWDLPGCATQLLDGTPDHALVAVATSPGGGAFRTSLVSVDPSGVADLAEYGSIEAFAPAALIDRFARLWWFDGGSQSFMSRTPLR